MLIVCWSIKEKKNDISRYLYVYAFIFTFFDHFFFRAFLTWNFYSFYWFRNRFKALHVTYRLILYTHLLKITTFYVRHHGPASTKKFKSFCYWSFSTQFLWIFMTIAGIHRWHFRYSYVVINKIKEIHVKKKNSVFASICIHFLWFFSTRYFQNYQ